MIPSASWSPWVEVHSFFPVTLFEHSATVSVSFVEGKSYESNGYKQGGFLTSATFIVPHYAGDYPDVKLVPGS